MTLNPPISSVPIDRCRFAVFAKFITMPFSKGVGVLDEFSPIYPLRDRGLRTQQQDDVMLMFAFSLIGYVMRKFDILVAPCILTLVLGDMAELSLRRALLLSGGSPLDLLNSPISVVLLACALFSILYPMFKKPKMLQGV